MTTLSRQEVDHDLCGIGLVLRDSERNNYPGEPSRVSGRVAAPDEPGSLRSSARRDSYFLPGPSGHGRDLLLPAMADKPEFSFNGPHDTAQFRRDLSGRISLQAANRH